MSVNRVLEIATHLKGCASNKDVRYISSEIYGILKDDNWSNITSLRNLNSHHLSLRNLIDIEDVIEAKLLCEVLTDFLLSYGIFGEEAIQKIFSEKSGSQKNETLEQTMIRLSESLQENCDDFILLDVYNRIWSIFAIGRWSTGENTRELNNCRRYLVKVVREHGNNEARPLLEVLHEFLKYKGILEKESEEVHSLAKQSYSGEKPLSPMSLFGKQKAENLEEKSSVEGFEDKTPVFLKGEDVSISFDGITRLTAKIVKITASFEYGAEEPMNYLYHFVVNSKIYEYDERAMIAFSKLGEIVLVKARQG